MIAGGGAVQPLPAAPRHSTSRPLLSSPSLFDQTPNESAWTVSRLVETAKRLMDRQLPPLWLKGEVLEFRRHRSGHLYLTLADDRSQVRCVMWRDDARRVNPLPQEGTEVFVQGAAGIYPARGEFRFAVKRMIPTAGRGLSQALFEQVKDALARDGLFDPARKRAIPQLASSVAVVTSTDGAALNDIVTVARKRWPLARLWVVGSRVQGWGSEDDLVAALKLVDRLDGIDACILGRGGGGREDLAAFNSEAVCRAVASLRVPSISAVGHERDITLADMVADCRAATPSAAAELAFADRVEVERHLGALGRHLAAALSRRTRLAEAQLARAGDRMGAGIERYLAGRREVASRLGATLEALSPLKVLERGYSMARSDDGRVLSRVEDLPAGRRFNLRVSDGEVEARVEQP